MVIVFAFFFGLAGLAASQEVTTSQQSVDALISGPITKDAARELLSRLSDAEVRRILLARLDAVADESAEQEQEISFSPRIVVTNTLKGLARPVQRLSQYPEFFAERFRVFADGRPNHLRDYLFRLAAMLAIGLGAAFVAEIFLRRTRRRISEARPETLWETIKVLLRRFVLDAGAVAVFLAAASAVAVLLFEVGRDREVAWDLAEALATIGIVYYAARMLLAPSRPDLRLVNTDDWTARFLTRRMSLIAAFTVLFAWLIDWTYETGAPPGFALLGFWGSTITTILLALTVWQARHGIVTMMTGHEEEMGRFEKRIVKIWPTISVILIIAIWVLIEALIANVGFFPALAGARDISLLAILFAPVLDTMIRNLSWRFFPEPEVDDPPGLAEARRHTRHGLVRIGRVVLFVALTVIMAGAWGINLFDMDDQGLWQRIVGAVVAVADILLFAYAAWEAVEILYWRQHSFEEGAKPEEDPDEPGGGEGGAGGGSRLGTVAPLLRRTAQTFIVLFAAIGALTELGFNITALIAGAGVVGLAIGFGAQTLVRDIVSGLFFLIDDAFRVGEYIDVGGTMGSVEKISLRSLRLRHHLGAVHTLPYGEIARLTNYSRDWVMMKLKFRVPFDTDIDKVRKLFKQIGKDLLNHPDIGENFLQPFKSQGVLELDDSAMVVRGKFMTKPGKQFTARKEIFNAVQKAFQENGIQFARREVRVHVPGVSPENEGELTPEQRQAVASAAAAGP